MFIFTWEFDLYGYERYVPAQEDVGSVTLSVDYMTPDAFTEQQNIADVRELHRRIINEKRSYEKRNYERYDGVWLMLNYELKDGSTTQRSYYLLNTAAEAEDKTPRYAGAEYCQQLRGNQGAHRDAAGRDAGDGVSGVYRLL